MLSASTQCPLPICAHMMSDIEKPRDSHALHIVTQEDLGECGSSSTVHQSRYQRWARSIKNLETQGVERVEPEDRRKPTASDSFHMLIMWFSMGLAVNHMVIGSIGTLVMQLSFKDAALCAIFGNLLGGISVGYTSTWGPRSGNRTLVCSSSRVLFISVSNPFPALFISQNDKEHDLPSDSMTDSDAIFHGLLSQQGLLRVERVNQSRLRNDQHHGRRPDPL